MTLTSVRYANLDQDRLARLQALEEDLGAYLVAYEPRNRLAELSPDQLNQLRSLEEQLGVILIAYNNA